MPKCADCEYEGPCPLGCAYMVDLVFEPLPVLTDELRALLASVDTSEYHYDDLPDDQKALFDELFAEGLACDNDGDGLPCEICVTNAGRAYLEGRRLPRLIIPPYEE